MDGQSSLILWEQVPKPLKCDEVVLKQSLHLFGLGAMQVHGENNWLITHNPKLSTTQLISSTSGHLFLVAQIILGLLLAFVHFSSSQTAVCYLTSYVDFTVYCRICFVVHKLSPFPVHFFFINRALQQASNPTKHLNKTMHVIIWNSEDKKKHSFSYVGHESSVQRLSQVHHSHFCVSIHCWHWRV